MRDEPARGWNPDPQRAPAPPVTTRRAHSDAPDPGAASGRLPPFRAGPAGSARAEEAVDLGFDPAIDIPLVSSDSAPESLPDAAFEPSDELDLEPVADARLDADPQPESRPADLAYEPEGAEPAAHGLEADLENVWFLDEVVGAEEGETEPSAGDTWPSPDVPGLELNIVPALDSEELDAGQAGASFALEPADAAGDVDTVMEAGSAGTAEAEPLVDVEPANAVGAGSAVLGIGPADLVGEAEAILEVEEDAETVLDVEEVDAARNASPATEVEPIEAAEADPVLEIGSADADEASAVLDLERLGAGEPDGDEEARDPLGEALDEAVTRADPPFAEDLVGSMDADDGVVVDDAHGTVTAAGSSPKSWEARTPETDVADVSGPAGRPTQARPPRDGFTEDLAATLESLAGSLRARGFSALDDAFARGDRLESSLALFLAGYRAGRGE